MVGELADFMIDGRAWTIREIVVQFGSWFSGKAIRIPTEKISRISYDDSTVYVDLTKKVMADADEHHGAETPVPA